MAKAKTKTKRWDAADYLKSDRDVIAYLEALSRTAIPASSPRLSGTSHAQGA